MREPAPVLAAAAELVLMKVNAPRPKRLLGENVAPRDERGRSAEILRQKRAGARDRLLLVERRCRRGPIPRAESRALPIHFDRSRGRRVRARQEEKQARDKRADHAVASLPAGTSTSRLPFDCIGETRPARSICSIRRAARL